MTRCRIQFEASQFHNRSATIQHYRRIAVCRSISIGRPTTKCIAWYPRSLELPPHPGHRLRPRAINPLRCRRGRTRGPIAGRAGIAEAEARRGRESRTRIAATAPKYRTTDGMRLTSDHREMRRPGHPPRSISWSRCVFRSARRQRPREHRRPAAPASAAHAAHRTRRVLRHCIRR